MGKWLRIWGQEGVTDQLNGFSLKSIKKRKSDKRRSAVNPPLISLLSRCSTLVIGRTDSIATVLVMVSLTNLDLVPTFAPVRWSLYARLLLVAHLAVTIAFETMILQWPMMINWVEHPLSAPLPFVRWTVASMGYGPYSTVMQGTCNKIDTRTRIWWFKS